MASCPIADLHDLTTFVVFTMAMPVLATLLNDQARMLDADSSRDWVALPPPVPWMGAETETVDAWAEDLDRVQLLLLQHWCRALAETTAVFELLPRFCTMPQVFSIYDSLRGNTDAEQDRPPLDAGNFHKWLTTSNQKFLTRHPRDASNGSLDETIKHEVQRY